MRTVHLEGMGINGCLTALMLERQGVDFTWNDIEAKRTAWEASTGAVYPANSTKFGDDWACYQLWADAYNRGVFGPVADTVERGNYTFNHKSGPPHGGKYACHPDKRFGLTVAVPKSYHINAQKLVPAVRHRFADRRLPEAPTRETVDLYLITHSFGERLSHVYWGWSRLVKLDYDKDLFELDGERPCFYFREGRFVMAYAYPVPGSPFWYAGSSIIKQRLDRMKSLDIEPKYEKWRENFQRLSNGAVQVRSAHAMLEGWRPAPASDDTAWLRREGNNAFSLRPLWNSGIRHYPHQWSKILSRL